MPTVEALRLDDVLRVARAHLDDERVTTLVVGDRAIVEPGLATLGLGVAEALLPA